MLASKYIRISKSILSFVRIHETDDKFTPANETNFLYILLIAKNVVLAFNIEVDSWSRFIGTSNTCLSKYIFTVRCILIVY